MLRRVSAFLFGLVVLSALMSVAAPRAAENPSNEAILSWINNFRFNSDPARVPDAVRAMSRAGAFRDPEQAGVYVGFLAGVLNSHPARAEQLVEAILPLPPEDQWAVVRAIAYSDLPHWKGMLHGFAMHMPGRKPMIDRYLAGELPTLAQLQLAKSEISLTERVRGWFHSQPAPKLAALEPSPDLIDTLWGFYFATGAYEPVASLIAMLPWSQNDDDVETLTLGGMAKYTLATNAARDFQLLAMLRWAAEQQPDEIKSILREIVVAAESVETGRIRREALAAIEELKRKGPGYRRKVAWWGQIGQGALSLGCIAAAATGQVGLGVPCVVGGAVSSAALNAWSAQP